MDLSILETIIAVIAFITFCALFAAAVFYVAKFVKDSPSTNRNINGSSWYRVQSNETELHRRKIYFKAECTLVPKIELEICEHMGNDSENSDVEKGVVPEAIAKVCGLNLVAEPPNN